MVEVEFRIVSERREGLLIQLGRLIAAHGFMLLRPRMVRSEHGVVLTVVVRGGETNLLPLQDRLGSHPMVQSFEASEPNATLTTAAPVPEPVRDKALPASSGTMVESGRVEALLGSLAAAYPNVLDHAIAFEQTLPAPQREATLTYAGTRLGAWIYKRDFALGARLPLLDSIRNIALPALRQMLRGIQLHEGAIHIASSPFCGLGLHRGASCHFLKGCIEGLLSEPGHLGHVRVREANCRNAGASMCSFAALS